MSREVQQQVDRQDRLACTVRVMARRWRGRVLQGKPARVAALREFSVPIPEVRSIQVPEHSERCSLAEGKMHLHGSRASLPHVEHVHTAQPPPLLRSSQARYCASQALVPSETRSSLHTGAGAPHLPLLFSLLEEARAATSSPHPRQWLGGLSLSSESSVRSPSVWSQPRVA